jgi:uncharacterized membrane protein
MRDRNAAGASRGTRRDGAESKSPVLKSLLGIMLGISLVGLGLFISIFTSFTIIGILLGIPFMIAGVFVPYKMIKGTSAKSW